MNYTSAEANKLLKKLNDEYTALLDKETRSREFRAAMGEDVASVRPAYDYAETQARLAALEEKIRRLKHAINCFNTTHFVDGFDMTIDEMLVYIPQLTRRKNKLLEMKSRLPKERVEEQYGQQSNLIDYRYANYDIAAVEADYDKTVDELSRAQLALDAINGSSPYSQHLRKTKSHPLPLYSTTSSNTTYSPRWSSHFRTPKSALLPVLRLQACFSSFCG